MDCSLAIATFCQLPWGGLGNVLPPPKCSFSLFLSGKYPQGALYQRKNKFLPRGGGGTGHSEKGGERVIFSSRNV